MAWAHGKKNPGRDCVKTFFSTDVSAIRHIVDNYVQEIHLQRKDWIKNLGKRSLAGTFFQSIMSFSLRKRKMPRP